MRSGKTCKPLTTTMSRWRISLVSIQACVTARSIIMLVVSALTAVYLFYALLRPEKF